MSQPESPIQVTLKDQLIKPGLHVALAGSELSIRLSSEANTSTRAYVIHVPMREYELDRSAILRLDGQNTDLGETPSLIHTVQNGVLNLSLEQESLYDVLALHESSMVPTRIVTAEDDIPDGAVIDELKLMIAMKLNVFPQELKGIVAQFIANTTVGYNRHQLAYFGLKIGDIVATIIHQELFGMFFVDANDTFISHEKAEIREYILSQKK